MPSSQRNLALAHDFWNNVFMKRDASRFAKFFAAAMLTEILSAQAPRFCHGVSAVRTL
jgi:hypothetical protein